jgi:hypothetical protein
MSRHHQHVRRLQRAAHHLGKRIRHWKGVVGIGIGSKYTGGRRTGDDLAVRIYVQKKLARKRGREKIPTFVYGRGVNHKILKQHKFKTDVIAVGKIRACGCGAGSRLRSIPGGVGTISLLFRDKSSANGDFYVISCTHVLDRVVPFPSTPALFCDDCPSKEPFAELCFRCVAVDEELKYDAGIARVSPASLPQPDATVVATPFDFERKLTGILPAASLSPGLPVDCWMPVSANRSGNVDEHFASAWVKVDYGYAECQVANVFAVRFQNPPLEGDSGSLIFTQDNQVAGMLFASSEGGGDSGEAWGWCHPFEGVVKYLNQNIEQPVKCF